MIKPIILYAVFMPGMFSATLAQEATSCDEQVIRHRDWEESSKTEWHLRIRSSGKGELLYFGAQHVDEPAHAQFKEVRKQWESFKPTVALFEGPDRGVAGTGEETISRFGESGYVRFLAKQAGIKTMTLEPEFADTYAYLISHFPQNQVDIYMMAKEAMRLRTRKGYSKDQMVAELNKMLPMIQKMIAPAKLSINSVEELERDFKKYWGTLEWYQAPQEWFDPLKRSSETGGIFTNEINTLSSDYRDVHMYRKLADLVNKGEKVFAVVGRNHVPLQAPALKCAIK